MEYIGYLLFAALVFGACFLLDKGFTRLFHGKKQHRSGRALRQNKRYGSFGLVIAVLGVTLAFYGISDPRFRVLCLVAGIAAMATGAAMIVYYMTFGIYYDDDSILLCTFGRKSREYAYGDIRGQMLYIAGASVMIELHFTDGNTVMLSANVDGLYPFLDYAFERWLIQTGRKKEDCKFYDPGSSHWFPDAEV